MVLLTCYQLVDTFATTSTSTNLVDVIQHKVFVAGISSSCTEHSLQSTFTQLFGTVQEVLIVGQAQSTQKQKGFKPYAFVTFENESSVQKAISAPKPYSTDSSSADMLYTEIQLARPITKRKRSNASRIKERDIIHKVELFGQHANCILQVQHTHLDRLMHYLQHQHKIDENANSSSDSSSSCKVLGSASAQSKNISLLFLNCVDPIKVTRMLISKSELLARAINQSYIVKTGRLLEGDLVSEEGCNEFAKIVYQTILSSQQQERKDNDDGHDVALRMKVFPPMYQSRLLQSFDAIINENINNESGLPRFSINPKEFTHVLSIVEVYQSQGRGWMNNNVKNTNLFMVGLAEASLVEDVVDMNNSITATSGANNHDEADDESINNHQNDAAVEVCRAYYKLKEAIETYIANNNLHQDLYRSVTALDCGSSPGGWTKYLIEHFHCSKVYSIDPGLLAPSVLNMKETHHVQTKIQDAVPLLLKEDVGAARVKIWVSDMCLHNMEAQVDLLLMAKESGLLASNAFFVLTLKCIVGHSKSAYDAQVKKTVDKLCDSSKVENVETFHLFSNRSGERTVMGYIN